MRCFVAISLPEAVREALAALLPAIPVGRTPPEENLHLTLAFLGELPEGAVLAVHEALGTTHAAPFPVEIGGLDLFGGKTPKILFAGVRRSEALAALHAAIHSRLAGAGIALPRERFRPHVTLARFNRAPMPDQQARLGYFLQAHGLASAPAFTAEEFSLFRSDLGHGPARHTEIARYVLGQAGRVEAVT